MKILPRETVIFAENMQKMVQWYQEALGFKITANYEADYHYCNMASESGIRIGIALADEMNVKTFNRKNNTVIMQIAVKDVKAFFAHLEKTKAGITFGPSFDEKGLFWYGGFEDIEGNPWWVVDKNCP